MKPSNNLKKETPQALTEEFSQYVRKSKLTVFYDHHYNLDKSIFIMTFLTILGVT